jgi:hypothetical protein
MNVAFPGSATNQSAVQRKRHLITNESTDICPDVAIVSPEIRTRENLCSLVRRHFFPLFLWQSSRGAYSQKFGRMQCDLRPRIRPERVDFRPKLEHCFSVLPTSPFLEASGLPTVRELATIRAFPGTNPAESSIGPTREPSPEAKIPDFLTNVAT